MNELRPEQMAEAWSKASKGYDENIAGFMKPWVKSVIELAQPQSTHRALEVAAGSGAATVELAPIVSELLATDFSPGMLALNREHIEELAIKNVQLAEMDGQRLDVEDESFDVAISNFGLMLFPDRQAGFSELRRALRPGGRAVVSAWSVPERFPAFSTFIAAVKKAIPDFEPPPGTPPLFSLADKSAFASEMTAAGFSEVEVHTISHPYETESPESYWAMIKDAAPPTTILLERLGEEGTERVREQLLELVRAEHGDGPIRLVNEAHIGVGVV